MILTVVIKKLMDSNIKPFALLDTQHIGYKARWLWDHSLPGSGM